jgi:hypothetical protein
MNAMRLFTNRRKEKKYERWAPMTGHFTVPEKPEILEKLSDVLERYKVRVARRLTEWSEFFSVATKKIGLVGFAIAVSAMCLSLMLSPFSEPVLRKVIVKPVEKHRAIVFPPGGASAISQEDFDKMISFKHILDSLIIHDPATYQILIRGRQSLVDSIDYLIRYRDQ